MTTLERLRLMHRLPIGAAFPPEIMGREKSVEAAISKLCGEAAYELQMMKDLNFRLMAAISDLKGEL